MGARLEGSLAALRRLGVAAVLEVTDVTPDSADLLRGLTDAADDSGRRRWTAGAAGPSS